MAGNWQTYGRGWITVVESLMSGILIGSVTNGNFPVTKGNRKSLEITQQLSKLQLQDICFGAPFTTRNLHDYDN